MASYEKKIRETLENIVKNMEKCKFVLNPEKDFTRDRKMDFAKTIFMAL